MHPIMVVAIAAAVGLVAFGLGYVLKQNTERARMSALRSEAEKTLAAAKTKLQESELMAKEAALKIRDEVEREANRRRVELERQERRFQQRRVSLDRRMDSLEERAHALEARERQLNTQRNELDELRHKELEELERIANLTTEEAKNILLERVAGEARQDMARVIRDIEQQATEEAESKAREIITLAIQRVASDQVAETTVSTVALPSDEMKGRIIGRGGRNIRTIENATGVDLLIDDTPEAVTVSSFDPVRREVARIALSKLIVDGRIHPARIEKVVAKAQQEVDAAIQEAGEAAVLEVGIHGLHPELIRLLGQLKYRTSYGQNQLMHSVESAHLAGIMAVELGPTWPWPKRRL
ncbi:MAG TPA: Rnase Y domain-containing protein, partial [Anaerolineae bacterium]|nr:Rnase Y domain-containing protein [Anaerolineae bacterium]